MEVILLENIKKLGKIGSKVKVANGFARNYLLKNNKALVASKENLAIFEKRREELNKKNNELKNEAVKIQKEIDKFEFGHCHVGRAVNLSIFRNLLIFLKFRHPRCVAERRKRTGDWLPFGD